MLRSSTLKSIYGNKWKSACIVGGQKYKLLNTFKNNRRKKGWKVGNVYPRYLITVLQLVSIIPRHYLITLMYVVMNLNDK